MLREFFIIIIFFFSYLRLNLIKVILEFMVKNWYDYLGFFREFGVIGFFFSIYLLLEFGVSLFLVIYMI